MTVEEPAPVAAVEEPEAGSRRRDRCTSAGPDRARKSLPVVVEEPVQVVEEPIAVVETPAEVVVVEEVLAASARTRAEKKAKPRAAKPAAKKTVHANRLAKKPAAKAKPKAGGEETGRQSQAEPGQKVEEITRFERDREILCLFF